jgi:hypothetical protein
LSVFLNVNAGWPDYPRAELRARIVELHAANGTTVPADAIDEIVDLACHAAASARTSLFTVLASCSDPRIAITAVGPAIGMLGGDLSVITEAQEDFAKMIGAPFAVTTIKGARAHG